MTYQETLAYIYGLGRFGMKPGLDKITLLLSALGNPHSQIRTVHVAGTNGKGSTASFLAAILSAGGYRVGLYTSPHLVSFTERFRINGIQITEDEVVAQAARVIAVAPPATTFFEIVTAMAFLWFADRQVDVAIMEVGMGGRLDATNAADGVLAVITPVSLDHCAHLGTTIGRVAAEKCGIIKENRPVVSSGQSPEALAVIEAAAARHSSPLYRFGNEFSANWRDATLDYCGMHTAIQGVVPGIGGTYQVANAATALAAAEVLCASGFPLDGEALRQGIGQAVWPGRMELVSEAPRILLDCAHNPAGAAALAESLAVIPRDRLLMVVGMMGDKDAAGILDPLLSRADEVFAVAPSLERACPSTEVAALCRSRGARCTDAGTVAAGLAAARQAAGHNDLIVVCGSIFTVGEAKGVLSGTVFEPFRG